MKESVIENKTGEVGKNPIIIGEKFRVYINHNGKIELSSTEVLKDKLCILHTLSLFIKT